MCDSRVTCPAGTLGVWAAHGCEKHLRSETATASRDQNPGVDVMWIGKISLEKEEAVGSSIRKRADVPDDF